MTTLVSSSIGSAEERGDPLHARAGQPSPKLELHQLLQAPEGAEWSWDFLRGNVVILEFWFVGCGPCMELFPFLANLERALADEPIRFISVTFDDLPTVQEFLRTHQVPGWIGLDNDKKTVQAYGITSYPQAAVISRDGIFLGWKDPRHLAQNPEFLRAVVRGESVVFDTGPPNERNEPEWVKASKDDAAPLCMIRIGAPAHDGKLPTHDVFRIPKATAKEAVAAALGVPSPYVEWRALADDETHYEVVVRGCTRERREAKQLALEALKHTFGLRVTKNEKLMEVYLLTKCDGKIPRWEPALSQVRFDAETGLIAPTQEILDRMRAGEQFFLALGSSANLADNLSHAVRRPVIDEAKIDGYYHFCFPMNLETDAPEKAIEQVKEKYGLCLTPDQRMVEVFEIEGVSPKPRSAGP